MSAATSDLARDPDRRRRPRGQALVEMAIAVPVLLLLFVAIAEGGSFAFTLSSIQNAAQEGGRLAALPGTPTEAAVQDRVVERARPVQLTSSDVAVSVNSGATPFVLRTSGDRVRVTVELDYQPLLAFAFGGLVFALTADAEYVVE